VGWGGESEGKKAKKHMVWDEKSLTEWQREKKTASNNTDKKHLRHAVFSPPIAHLASE